MIVLSCSSPPADGEGGRSPDPVTDDLGREVAVPRVPARIVSLAPNATEILFSIGAGDRIVGVTDFCDYPPRAKEIAKVGSFSFLNVERILSVAPDFVVLSSHEQERFLKTLDALGIPVYVCFPRNFDELFRSIRALGALAGSSERAGALVDSLETELDRLKERVDTTFAEAARPRVYVEISSRPLMTVGESSFIGGLITAAGGMNIGHDVPRDYAVINPEVIISRDPEIIFIMKSSSSRENVMKRLGWEGINAVKSGRIFDNLDEDRILRPGPRSVRGAQDIFEHLVSIKEAHDKDLDR